MASAFRQELAKGHWQASPLLSPSVTSAEERLLRTQRVTHLSQNRTESLLSLIPGSTFSLDV